MKSRDIYVIILFNYEKYLKAIILFKYIKDLKRK